MTKMEDGKEMLKTYVVILFHIYWQDSPTQLDSDFVRIISVEAEDDFNAQEKLAGTLTQLRELGWKQLAWRVGGAHRVRTDAEVRAEFKLEQVTAEDGRPESL
jgi:hypothetical protein